MIPPEVEALLFDVFGTVVDWRTSVARQLRAFLAPRGVERDWEAMAAAWRRRYQPAMEAVRTGRRPFVKLDLLHRENLVGVLGEHGIAGLDEAEIDGLNRAWHRLDPWPDVVPGLGRLRHRYILAPCSNGNVRLMVDVARHGGLPWNTVLGAEAAGAYKPQPRAYLASAAFLDLPPGACMMVAAHNGDLAAARAVGLRTAFVPRPHEHGPGQTTDLAPEGPWDVVASDLEALATALGC